MIVIVDLVQVKKFFLTIFFTYVLLVYCFSVINVYNVDLSKGVCQIKCCDIYGSFAIFTEYWLNVQFLHLHSFVIMVARLTKNGEIS